MFQSERLQEKWAPLLDYEGLDSIKDSHRRVATSSPARKPREVPQRGKLAFSSGINLMETPNVNTDPGSTGNAGFSGRCH